jgi:hypothetical protein
MGILFKENIIMTKNILVPIITLAVCGVFICIDVKAADDTPETRGQNSVLNSVGLLPQHKSYYGSPGTDYLEEQIGRELTDSEKKLFNRTADGKWRTFSDNLIEFELPEDPLLKVEAFTPSEQPELEVVGGVASMADNTFQRVYRIMLTNEIPYLLVLVRTASWFDEGICLCGPIHLKTFALADGNLIEFSQLPGGNIKKVQVINDTHRAILFEWTHSAITQDAYRRIGASIRLKPASKRTEEDWIDFSGKKRGFEAGLGWLRIGTPVSKIRELLGPPTKIDDKQLVYVKDEIEEDGSGWRTRVYLPVKDGKLQRFEEKWMSQDELKPIHGSQAWIRDTLNRWSEEQDELEEGKHPKLPREDVDLILNTFHKEASYATGWDWSFWCRVIGDLMYLGIQDRKAVDMIVKRINENDLPQAEAVRILNLYNVPGLLEMVYKRLLFLMGSSSSAKKHREECDNLFARLKAGNKESEALIRKGVVHEDASIRGAATDVLNKLPLPEAQRLHKKRIVDPDEYVRLYAIMLVDKLYSTNDVMWLKEIAIKEGNERNRETLEEIIDQLKL